MELKLEIEKFGFRVLTAIPALYLVDDVIIKTRNEHSISLKKLLKDLGEL